ncbi:serine hydrolase [Erythrobacter sp. BLCC-B19]|uniref:serine hydrolase n=1 Tax=Erythrobacter sp. BLCC-B19 TaxID=3025315 RepID=UPI0023621F16|nr:serine hydrolase [Erythrobacter sp. BLCC-B19]WDA42393.1 class A beta-lactamase-related serine hydrolase [Erythrobacter sp. BLCC-B19]
MTRPRFLAAFTAFAASLAAVASPAAASPDDLEETFAATFGTEVRQPPSFEALYANNFQQRIAELADPAQGRIGVAAVDLATGEEIMVLGDQLFPMASTSKVAVAATFLEMVEQGRYSLTSEFPLMLPIPSAKYSSAKAPVRAGQTMSAIDLIEIMITRSSNPATDALLAAVGGPGPVNDWMRRQGITNFSINRDIATLVRDDGEYNPATTIDTRDAATPRAMVRLLAGLYRGDFLSDQSRQVLLGAMSRTVTGKRRIPAYMPLEARVSHKTGSLSNTSSDVGIIECPDGRVIAVAIYVTGQGGKAQREERIAAIARALYDGFAIKAQTILAQDPTRNWTSAPYATGG